MILQYVCFPLAGTLIHLHEESGVPLYEKKKKKVCVGGGTIDYINNLSL